MLWLVFGSAGVVTAVVMGVNTVAGLARPAELTGVPTCTGDASQDCLTRGPATVDRETSSRFRWLSGERKWFLDVSAVDREVRGSDDDTPKVIVPEQPGQDELQEGMEVTVVYHDGRPVLLELPDSTVLETDEHPRRYGPTLGYLAVGVLGLSAFAVLLGWRNGRSRGWWRRVDYEEPNGGYVFATLFMAGMAGVITQSLAGSSRWPALVAFLVVAGALGVLLFFAKRRQAGSRAR